MKLARLSAAACAAASLLNAQSADAEIAKLKTAVAAAQSAGDNAWMLTSAALVLMMTGPGLALFYCGLVRKKNVLGTMMQSFIMMAVITLVWVAAGYSMVFGSGNPFVGGFEFAFLNGVGTAPNTDYAPTIPHLTFMVYQMMFAVISPALITGAFAERVKFNALLVYSVLWMFLVYFPVAHMIWGKGGFLNAYLGGSIPVFDFAGGIVVHVTTGISALVCALVIGPRKGYPSEPMMPHSLVLSFIGACLLWVGWFGFNAGSALAASGLAASAFVATHLGGAAGAVGWLVAEKLKIGRASALGGISGAVAGLATVTQGSGFVSPIIGAVYGLAGGLICFYVVTVIKHKFKYDDSLDAFGVHGIGGIIGATLTGVFATNTVNDALKLANGQPAPLGMVDGNTAQIGNQLAGAAIGVVIAVVGSYVALKVAGMVCGGLRLDPREETQGMDLAIHGEEGYNLEA
ncbi:MAG: ammonium transporter [Acidobacteria bacterium]|nr:ammonium transporter [Acidobacteriota bacterium]